MNLQYFKRFLIAYFSFPGDPEEHRHGAVHLEEHQGRLQGRSAQARRQLASAHDPALHLHLHARQPHLQDLPAHLHPLRQIQVSALVIGNFPGMIGWINGRAL